jgi:hypothetical protein
MSDILALKLWSNKQYGNLTTGDKSSKPKWKEAETGSLEIRLLLNMQKESKVSFLHKMT